MASGELSPWAPGGSAQPTGDPYAGSYHGPWGPPAAPPPVSDDLLRRLPPPVAGPLPTPQTGVQRPSLVTLAVTLAVTASLLWVCGLSLFGVVALAGTDALSSAGDDGVVFHTLDQFVLRMGDGLWVPLYGLPLVSIVTGFLLLSGRPWARVAHTAVGLATLGWAGWWLRDSLLAWFAVAVYVGMSVAVLWVPSVGRWYASRPRPWAAGSELTG